MDRPVILRAVYGCRWVCLGLFALAAAYCAGCRTPLDMSALRPEPAAPSIDDVKGPTERTVLASLWQRDRGKDDGDSMTALLGPPEGADEYAAAEALYKQGEYEGSIKALKQVAKQFKNSRIREDALFLKGEAHRELEQLPKAYDAYAEVLKDYPSTRYLDEISERLFDISRIWLDFPEFAEVGEIRQVDLEDPGVLLPPESPGKKPRSDWLLTPNFTDKTRPIFDTEGNALAALKMIWLNDPTGPLADDALMMTASHYARREKWIDADRTFGILREEYPDSPYLEKAFVLGSHVKLMSYQGAGYDGRNLQEARLLKETTLRLFPDAPERGRLTEELAKIRDADAARQWAKVEYYRRKRRPESIAVYCQLIIKDFGDTRFAEMAREQLRQMGPPYSNNAWTMNHLRSAPPADRGPDPDEGGMTPRPLNPDPTGRAVLE